MTPHFCPGAYWLQLSDCSEHMILDIQEDYVATISPPEPWKLETSILEGAPVCSWGGDHQAFFEEFAPPASAEVG